MSLCSMRELLHRAEKEHRAVGAFNVVNMETARGIVQAAEASRTPVILQLAEKRMPYAPLELLAPMMLNAAREAEVDIAVHLDHGSTDAIINKAMAYGFTSVMFDGSSLSAAENKYLTGEICKRAAQYSIDVEAELGVLGGSEGGPEMNHVYTDPDEVASFCKGLPINALAISVGNAHGHYKGVPDLNFGIIEQINALVDIPLVLHGGSGISDENFRKAIDAGIRKINIATANMDAQLQANRQYFASHNENVDFFELADTVVRKIYETTLHHIMVFNNSEPLSAAD